MVFINQFRNIDPPKLTIVRWQYSKRKRPSANKFFDRQATLVN